ncbi:DUF6250 domain-containing protein [Croceibacterium sp. TMG7-5b_MA50]|uniref:DUF6250 domain-containing protein n=1 Tax=Croceibacterium sp. TMG7-5b_MA50 TaxID=3121290 RepID=UPI00322218DF
MPLHRDDFTAGLGQWLVEAEQPSRVTATGGVLDIDAPAGISVWFRPELSEPVAIDYTVTAIEAGGPNDQVSDINAFWMATDTRAADGNVLSVERSGAFAGYDRLRTYYAGIGGNRNTSSRFRRYVGRDGDRPLLPRHDLTAPATLIEANRPYRIRLIADGRHIALLRDGVPMFELDDPDPYTKGHFALRTTWSHLQVRDLSVWRL